MIRNKPLKACIALAAVLAADQTLQAQTVAPAQRTPDGRVNTAKPGMRVRIYRGTSTLSPNAIIPAESYISGMPFVPATGLLVPNMPNTALLNYDQDNEFYERPWWVYQYINFHEAIDPSAPTNPTAGNFSTAQGAPHNVADIGPVPGLPVGNTDYYVFEATGWVDLRAGTTRFGVSSDDGFRLTIGAGTDLYAVPGTTPAGLNLIVLDGTRGVANTEANITVTQAGFYPIRLLWWEVTGTAASCELYTFGPGATSGNRFLIGDTTQANAVRVYYEVSDQPAQITGRFPLPGANNIAARPEIRAILENGKSPIDQASITLTVDGQSAPYTLGPSPEGSATNVRLDTAPGALGPYLPGSTHTVVIAGQDTSAPPVPFRHEWSFTVANYPTVPAAWSVGAVDREKPGFRAKLEHTQNFNTAPQTSQSWAAERRIARGFIDPATREPFVNLADLTTADSEGFYTDPDVINWGDAVGGAQGSFGNDEGHPGGLVGASERFVYGIETILEIPAGIYRLGVNTDDGFRLTAGRAPGEVTGMEITVANVDRGPTDTLGDVNIPADGFYPFRLMWWETGGGAAAEFFLINQEGQKILINDPASPIKAWRESANTPPAVTRVLPVVNEPYAYADQDIQIEILEKSIPVNLDSIELRINNEVQTITKTRTGNLVTVLRDSSVQYLLPSGANNVSLTYTYPAPGGSTTVADVTWSFNVPLYTRVVPAGNRVAASEVGGSGFSVYQVNQLDRDGSGTGTQANTGRRDGNNWPGGEIQLSGGYRNLAGDTFPNVAAAPFDAGPVTDVEVPFVNFNWTTGGTGNSGLLNGDTRGPGIPGAGTSNAGLDNTVHEMFTYIELKAGAHVFAVNVDDGHTFYSSPNPRDTLGTLLGWKAAVGGNLGYPINNPQVAFNVIVPEDGIYPFRSLFWQGGGGVNIEIAALDRDTGRLAAINDPSGAVAVSGQPGAPRPPYTPYVSYSTYTGPTRPWVRFSVYPPRMETAFFNNTYQTAGPGPMNVRLPNSGNPGDIINVANTRAFSDGVGAIIADAGNGPIGLLVDGERVTPTITTLPNGDKQVMYTPATPLAAGTHTAGLEYAGTINYWTFNVLDAPAVLPGSSRPVTDIIPDKRGFRVRTAQYGAARTGGNSAAAAEAQLADTAGNIGVVNPDRPDGAYIVPGIINMNINKNNPTPGADIGNFTAARGPGADAPFPGLNGTDLPGATEYENFTSEIFAWLELPAGYQKFGWNGDDGFFVQIGMPGETSGQTLFTIDRGGGAADIPFAFVTPEAGLYPIRIVFYQGNGGGNIELFTFGPNNEKIPLNDPSNAAAIRAHYEIAGGVQPEPVITFGFANGILNINWTNGGTLESSSAVTGGAWTSTGDSDGSFQVTIPGGGGATFYRVNRP